MTELQTFLERLVTYMARQKMDDITDHSANGAQRRNQSVLLLMEQAKFIGLLVLRASFYFLNLCMLWVSIVHSQWSCQQVLICLIKLAYNDGKGTKRSGLRARSQFLAQSPSPRDSLAACAFSHIGAQPDLTLSKVYETYVFSSSIACFKDHPKAGCGSEFKTTTDLVSLRAITSLSARFWITPRLFECWFCMQRPGSTFSYHTSAWALPLYLDACTDFSV